MLEDWEPCDVIKVDFSRHDFRAGPAIIIEVRGEEILVCSGTKQDWHEGDDAFYPMEKGTGNVRCKTYINCRDVYAVTEEEILEYWGEVDDETFCSIIERMRNYGTEI